MENGFSMKEFSQIEAPAMLGFRERVKRFRAYVEANRKQMKASKLVATFALESGLRNTTVEGYLKLLYAAEVYVKPNYYTEFMIVTPEEYAEIRRSVS